MERSPSTLGVAFTVTVTIMVMTAVCWVFLSFPAAVVIATTVAAVDEATAVRHTLALIPASPAVAGTVPLPIHPSCVPRALLPCPLPRQALMVARSVIPTPIVCWRLCSSLNSLLHCSSDHQRATLVQHPCPTRAVPTQVAGRASLPVRPNCVPHSLPIHPCCVPRAFLPSPLPRLGEALIVAWAVIPTTVVCQSLLCPWLARLPRRCSPNRPGSFCQYSLLVMILVAVRPWRFGTSSLS